MDDFQLKRLEVMEDRLHDHIEHYSQNNKTLALLSQRMDYFISRFDEHDKKEVEYNKLVDEHLKRMAQFDIDKAKELVEGYRGIMSIRNILLGLAAVAVAIGTLGAATVGVIHVLKG